MAEKEIAYHSLDTPAILLNLEKLEANIKEMLEIPILGIVPEDKHVERALLKKNAVIHTKPKSRAARAYEKIAYKLLGRERHESLGERIANMLGL